MPRIYKSNIFDFPRRKKRIAWYVEVLCAELLKQDEIRSEDIGSFWKEVNRIKEEKLPFSWQRHNMEAEAREGLTNLLSNYQYDRTNRVYKRK